jgi:hypothetical protein
MEHLSDKYKYFHLLYVLLYGNIVYIALNLSLRLLKLAFNSYMVIVHDYPTSYTTIQVNV